MLALEVSAPAEPAAPSCVYVACAGAEQAPVVFGYRAGIALALDAALIWSARLSS